MKTSSRFLSVLLVSALAAACAPSETIENDAGSGAGGASAAGNGGGGLGGEPGRGGTSGTAGVTGTAGVGPGGSSGGSAAAGRGGTTGTAGGGGTSGVAGTSGGRGGTTGAGGSGGVTGAGGSGGTTGGGGTTGAAGTSGRGGSSGGGGGRGGATAGTTGTGGATGGAGGATAYNPCPTNGDVCKVLPLGDSITFGINYEGSYRVELFKQSVTANQKITFVGTQTNGPAMAPGTTVPFPMHHEGWSGYTISMILSKASGDVQYAPHMILLHAGTNDTYMSGLSAQAPATLSSAVGTLTTMFPNALIVVAKIIPYPSQTANVKLINDSIPAMVQMWSSMGKHVTWVDLNTGFQTSTMLSSDGIHPNQTGYNWMGDTWYAAIGALFPK
jgi:hypothetical protein